MSTNNINSTVYSHVNQSPVLNYGNSGASLKLKSLQTWVANLLSPDDDITINSEILRARSRDLFMSSGIASGALRTMTTGVIGSGMMLKIHIDREILGLSEEQAQEWEHKTQFLWNMWSNTTDCDALNHLTFFQIQSLAYLSALMNGDVFVGFSSHKRLQSPFYLKLRLIEADKVCNPNDIASIDDRILGGVEQNEYGEVVAYHISKKHPYSSFNIEREWVRIPAFDQATGRPNILHFRQEETRIEQRRGVPLLSETLELFKQLKKYTDAEMAAAVINAMLALFIRTNDTSPNLFNTESLINAINSPGTQQTKSKIPLDMQLGNQSVMYLEKGEDIVTANTSRPNQNFAGFVEAILRQIGASTQIPYELLIKHFTSSYSASRASMLQAWQMFKTRRQYFADQFLTPIYKVWLSEAIALGLIKADDFFSDPLKMHAWLKCEWTGDAQGQIDPLKEVNAAQLRINCGLSTRAKEASELAGLDAQDILEERAAELKSMEKFGLKSFNLDKSMPK